MTSTRILCRPCYDKRQSEKYAAKAKAAAAAGAAPAPAPAPAAAQKHAPPPAAAKPASAPPIAAKPAPAPAAPAHHAEPAHASHGSHESHASHGDPAHKSTVGQFSRHGPKKKAEEPVDVKTKLRAESTAVMDHTTKIGLLVMLVFVVVAGGVVGYVVHTKKTDDALAKAEEKKLDDFLATVKKEDVKTIEGATGVMKITDASKEVWVGTRIAGEINSMRVTAGNTIQADADKKEFFDRLTGLEAQSKDVGTKTAEELRKMRITADSLALSAQSFGPEAVGRINLLRRSLQSLIGTKLKEEAVAYADGPGKSDPRAALQKLASAEDDVRSLWETMYKENDAQGKTLFEAYFKDLVARSDKLSNEYFTDALIEQTPWRDLLTGDTANEWVFKSVKGSTSKIVGGALFLTGGDPDARGRALNVIGDKEQWRDFVIKGEFTVESGGFTMAFRLGANLDRNSEGVDVHTDEGKIQPGGTYSFVYRLVGSAAKMTWKENVLEAQDKELMYSTPRHGAFGIVVEKGTKVTFKQLLIRELR
jgi:hypothetical protein